MTILWEFAFIILGSFGPSLKILNSSGVMGTLPLPHHYTTHPDPVLDAGNDPLCLQPQLGAGGEVDDRLDGAVDVDAKLGGDPECVVHRLAPLLLSVVIVQLEVEVNKMTNILCSFSHFSLCVIGKGKHFFMYSQNFSYETKVDVNKSQKKEQIYLLETDTLNSKALVNYY